MELSEVMRELEGFGSEQSRKIYTKHGAKPPMFGVKVADMKKILKKTKKDHALALKLYDTGNADAMYLGSLMADEKRATPEELERWVSQAEWYMVGEYGVAGVAAESPHGWDLGNGWIESEHEHVASAGWATLGGFVGARKDEDLDLAAVEALLDRVGNTIHDAANRVRYTMNAYVMCVGSYVAPLADKALKIAEKIGKVSVDMGGTACKVPVATEALQKIITMDRVGKKRKKVRC